MGINVPKSFRPYLYLIAATQRMEKIPPLEIFNCIITFVGKKRGGDFLDDHTLNKLKAYCKKWQLVDFTGDDHIFPEEMEQFENDTGEHS